MLKAAFLTTERMRKYFVCDRRVAESGLEEDRREAGNLSGGAPTSVAGEKSREKTQCCRRSPSGSGWVSFSRAAKG